MNIDISAIIVTYNSASTIGNCLVSLQDALAGKNAEIIVVDNASKDISCEIVRNIFFSAKLLQMPKNIGFAAGVNKGISFARAQYFLFVNPDLVINRECVEGMTQFLNQNEKVGAIGPKLVYPTGEVQHSCRRYPTLRAILSHRLGFTQKFIGKGPLNSYLMKDTLFEDGVEVEWLMGACIMIRRVAIQDVGLFDERFFLYCEDADWCYRAQQREWKVFYLPQIKAIHHYKRDSARSINRQLLWHLKSMLILFYKHGFRF